jgi:hypothetical protein
VRMIAPRARTSSSERVRPNCGGARLCVQGGSPAYRRVPVRASRTCPLSVCMPARSLARAVRPSTRSG